MTQGPRPIPRHCEDQGSATVGYVLVSIMVMFLVGALLQVTLALHIRNLTIDAAQQGAQYAARDNVTVSEGVSRTRQILAQDLGGNHIQQVRAMQLRDAALGRDVIRVEVTYTWPLLGPYGIAGGATASAHAIKEPNYGP